METYRREFYYYFSKIILLKMMSEYSLETALNKSTVEASSITKLRIQRRKLRSMFPGTIRANSLRVHFLQTRSITVDWIFRE